MTDPFDSDDLLDDAEMERLLASIVSDQTRLFPQRKLVRQLMLDEFDNHAVASDLSVLNADSIAHSNRDPGVEVNIVDLDMLIRPEPPLAPSSGRRVLVAAALVAVVALLGAVGVEVAERLGNPAQVSTADGTRLVPGTASLPAPLPPGEHRTETVGDGIRLLTPDGIEVIEEREGRVVFGLIDDETEPRSRVTIVDVSGQATVDELLGDPELDGLVTVLERVATTADGLVPEWEIRLTAQVADRFGCENAGPCLAFGDVELWSHGTNLLSEIQGPDGQTIWWLEQSSTHLGPLHTDAAEILRTLRFD